MPARLAQPVINIAKINEIQELEDVIVLYRALPLPNLASNTGQIVAGNCVDIVQAKSSNIS